MTMVPMTAPTTLPLVKHSWGSAACWADARPTTAPPTTSQSAIVPNLTGAERSPHNWHGKRLVRVRAAGSFSTLHNTQEELLFQGLQQVDNIMCGRWREGICVCVSEREITTQNVPKLFFLLIQRCTGLVLLHTHWGISLQVLFSKSRFCSERGSFVGGIGEFIFVPLHW